MELNLTSTLDEIRQGLSGTYEISEADGWKVLENGRLRIFKKLVESGRSSNSITLPQKFIDNRNEITPYITFKRSTIGGGIINLQQTAIDLGTRDSMVVMIIQF